MIDIILTLCFLLGTEVVNLFGPSKIIIISIDIEVLKSRDGNPGSTFQKFQEYKRLELLFQLVFGKADCTAYSPSNGERKPMLLFKCGKDMKELFQYAAKMLVHTKKQ